MLNRHEFRCIDLGEEQKKQVLRMRNAESAKRSRQKKKYQRQILQRIYNENEKRIEILESSVDFLTRLMEMSEQNVRLSNTKVY